MARKKVLIAYIAIVFGYMLLTSVQNIPAGNQTNLARASPVIEHTEMSVLPMQVEYEDMGLKTLLILTIIALAGTVAYLYKNIAVLDEKHTKEIKEKDARITEIIKDHHSDVKENTKDMLLVVDRYHQFTQVIKELVNGRNNN